MYESGTYIVYGVQGVCKVIGTEKQLVNRKRTEFLVLEPLVKSESRFYVPTQNPTAMNKILQVLSREDLESLIASPQLREDCWVSHENIRKQQYRELLSSGNRMQILRMVCALYRYKDEQIAAGKKFHQIDDNFLRDAERLICSEISLVMEKTMEESREYLRSNLRA